MNIQQMRYFRSIAKNESITKAAEAFYIAPSAMSRLLRQLENELNAELFDRIGRNLILNANGEKLLYHIEFILNEYSEIENFFKSDSDLQTNKITICGLDGYILASILEKFQQRNPSISIANNQVGYSKAMDLLLEDKVNLIFSDELNVQRLIKTNNSKYEKIFLVKNKLFLSAPKNSHFSERDTLHLSDLTNEKFISYSDLKLLHFNEFVASICQSDYIKLNYIHDYDYDKFMKIKSSSPYLSLGDSLHISYYFTSHEKRRFIGISHKSASQNIFLCYCKEQFSTELLASHIKSEFLKIFK